MQSFDDQDGVIWLNGDMVEWREAKAHVLSHGLHYAGSIFEGARAYNGQIFKLTEHSQRFIKSGDLIDMPVPYSVEELNQACEDVLKANNLTDAYLRPVAWRGPEEMGIGAKHCKTYVAIAAWVWPSYFGKETLNTGISLMTSRWRRADPRTMPTNSKTACLYSVGTMAKNEASAAGFDDALMLDYRGYVAECSAANFFWIKDGEMHTPIPDCFLDGITRRTVMDLAKDRGITVVERVIMPDELSDADEIFVTGTAAEVTPIGRIDDIEFTVGDITRKLHADYCRLVGKD